VLGIEFDQIGSLLIFQLIISLNFNWILERLFYVVGMDPEFLPVRFHFAGQFFNDGKKLHYLGGKEQVSFVEHDKISLPEVIGHLRDHYNAIDPFLLHWLYPGSDLLSGLRVLVDDHACLEMSQSILDGGAADIFVEHIVVNGDDQSTSLDIVAQSIMQEVSVHDSAPLQIDYSSDKDGESDYDYLPGDDESSEEDEEAVQIRADLKELKKKLHARSMVVIDEAGHEVNVENLMASNPCATSLNDEGDSTDVNTDDEADSYDETSNGELFRKENKFPRFDGSAAVPSFTLGMKFTDKATFREAVFKYGLAEKRVIKFVKNEASKCRAVCSWPNCPWVLHLSKTSRSESWQLATCKDVHTCPPRRDNSLVTSRRIADKYEKFIKANPQWSI
jgi:alpha-galactosidase